ILRPGVVAFGEAVRTIEPVNRNEREASGVYELAHRGDIHPPGEQFRALRRIDAIIAAVARRPAGDAEVYLARTGIAHALHDLERSSAAHDRLVDEHDALAFPELAVGVVLALDAGGARAVRRLDEGATDIVRTDDAELERDARLLRIADRRRHTAVGHRYDQIRLDRRFAGQFDADLLARFIYRAIVEHRIRAAEIDVLEDAGAGRDVAERPVAAHRAVE